MTPEETASGESSGKDLPKVQFHYIKTNQFKDVHVDGVFGGVSPSGFIQMAVFTERVPIPQTIVHRIKEDGSLAEEVVQERVGRSGIVRDVDVNLIFNAQTARLLIEWLKSRVKQAEELEVALKSASQKGSK